MAGGKKYDKSYSDEVGTDIYWRDPKGGGRRGSFRDLAVGAHNRNKLIKAWDYQYGKKSKDGSRMRASDLYEKWMDDPNADNPNSKTQEELITEEEEEKIRRFAEKAGRKQSLYAAEPHKPKSNFRYHMDYAKDVEDSDEEDGKDGGNGNDGNQDDRTNDPDNDNDKDKNGDGKEDDNNDNDDNKNNPNDDDNKNDDSNRNDDGRGGEDGGGEDDPNNPNSLNDDDNDRNPQDDPLASSTGSGAPPSPAKRVRKYPVQRQRTKTQFDDDDLPLKEATEDQMLAKSGGRKPMRVYENVNSRKPSDQDGTPGMVPKRQKSKKDKSKSSSKRGDSKDRDREKEKKRSSSFRQSKKEKLTRSGSDSGVAGGSGGSGGWLGPSGSGTGGKGSRSARLPSPGPRKPPKEFTQGIGEGTRAANKGKGVTVAGDKNKKKKPKPGWKPWNVKDKEFNKAGYIGEDV